MVLVSDHHCISPCLRHTATSTWHVKQENAPLDLSYVVTEVEINNLLTGHPHWCVVRRGGVTNVYSKPIGASTSTIGEIIIHLLKAWTCMLKGLSHDLLRMQP
eukprot:scaffold277028_cov49-Prasinocladus_malaysianus.AAC.1